MKYLLIGGEFNNKGAEAMTLVAIGNIIRRDPNAVIYLWDKHTSVPFDLVSNVVLLDCSPMLLSILSGQSLSFVQTIKEMIKMIYPGKRSVFSEKRIVVNCLKTIDITIDISGYQLSSKWNDAANILYCNWINTMKSFGSRVYLMPQSFGPFDYSNNEILNLVKKTLPKCDRIYAREKKGYDDLRAFGLDNVELCYDSVLIDKCYSPEMVIKRLDRYEETFDISTGTNIAIVPNYRLIDRGGIDRSSIIDLYCGLIWSNPECDYYLVAHAGEDLILCQEVYKRFPSNGRVHLIEHVISSFNYEKFASKMSFVIASRYHSIIHAYRKCTPAIILGWADKYVDVAQLFDQTKYIVETNDIPGALQTISQMFINCGTEREIIRKHLAEAQEYNCYSFLNDSM